jgi:O-antigen/teichoic acid export membrane protein
MIAEHITEEPLVVEKSGRQLAVIILTQILSWGFALASTYILPKYRTIHEFAIFSVVFSVTGMIGAIADSGLGGVISRTVTSDTSRARNLIIASFALKATVSISILVVFNVIGWIIKYPVDKLTYISMAIACSLFGQLASSIKDIIRGLGKVSSTSVILLLERGMNCAIILALAITKQPLHSFIWVPMIFDFVGIAISWTSYRRICADVTPSSIHLFDEIKFVFSQFLLFASGSVFVHLKDPIVMLVLGYVASSEAIGGYSVAKRLLGSAVFVPVAFSQLGLPMLTSAFLYRQEAFHRQLHSLLRSALLVCIPMFVGFIFHGKQVLTVVGLYPKFLYGPIMLAMSAPMLMLLYIAMMLTSAIVAAGLQKKMVKGTILIACSVPIVSPALTYLSQLLFGNAGYGALTSDLLLELFLVGLYVRVLGISIVNKDMIGSVMRFCLLSIPLALAGFIHGRPMWILCTLGAILVYAGGLYKMGLLHKRMLEAGE